MKSPVNCVANFKNPVLYWVYDEEDYKKSHIVVIKVADWEVLLKKHHIKILDDAQQDCINPNYRIGNCVYYQNDVSTEQCLYGVYDNDEQAEDALFRLNAYEMEAHNKVFVGKTLDDLIARVKDSCLTSALVADIVNNMRQYFNR